MRKTVILGSIFAIIGLASVAQASDRLNADGGVANRVHSETSDDSQTDRLDRTARNELRERRHDERRDRSRAHHDDRASEAIAADPVMPLLSELAATCRRHRWPEVSLRNVR